MATATEILMLVTLWCGKPGEGASMAEIRGCRKALLSCVEATKKEGRVPHDKVWECMASQWKRYPG